MRRALALIAFAFPSTALAGTVTVGAGGDYPTVDAALAATDPDEALKVHLLDGDHAAFTVEKAREVLVSGGGPGKAMVAGLRVRDPGASVVVQQLTLRGDGDGRAALVVVEAGAAQLSGVEAKGGEADSAVIAGPSSFVEIRGSLLHGFEGSAIQADHAVLTIGSTRIADGTADEGAGLRAVESAISLDGVVFAHLQAVGRGGALLLDQGSVDAQGVELEDVRAQRGGGLYMDGVAANISDLTARGGFADQGGHIYAYDSEISLVRADLRSGRARDGAALYVDGSGVRVRNALIVDHTATARGGAVWVASGDLDLRQATIFGARAPSAAGVGVGAGAASLRASVLAGLSGLAVAVEGDGSASLRDSLLWDIEGTPWLDPAVAVGPTQMTMDPRFTNTAAKDFTLRAGSPGLDAGPLGTVDPDGTRADLGAYGGPLAWVLPDVDGDGFAYGRDCDDNDRLVHEGAPDRPYDGIDADCDMRSDYDQDRDGVEAVEYGGLDCDDTDARVRPGAAETPGDSRDQDCDGRLNPDMDGDGWEVSLDCDDLDASIRPDAIDTWYDGIDSDCSGGTDFDQDGDGVMAAAGGGSDCDDADPRVHGLMIDEAADGLDQDCDGVDGPSGAAAGADSARSTLAGQSAEPGAEDIDRAPMGGEAPASEMTQTGCAAAGGAPAGGAGLLAGLLGLAGLARRRRA